MEDGNNSIAITHGDLEWILTLSEEDLDAWLNVLSQDGRHAVIDALSRFNTQNTPEYKAKLESSFYEFVKEAWSLACPDPFVDGWHIQCVCDHLQAVHEGEIAKLIVNIPPGCSKSLITCVLWPAWRWALDPTVRIMSATYGQRLSERDSVKTRTIVNTNWYKSLWGDGTSISRVQDQKKYFQTNAGGWRLSTTPGGEATGEHPDTVLVDDPQNARKAESEAERKRVIDWWELTITSRGAGFGSTRVLIMQRLNEGDLSGLLLSHGDCIHVMLPMEYEPDRQFRSHILNRKTGEPWCDPRTKEGELLWPEFYTREKVEAVKRGLGAYGSAGQLQQRPAPKKGGVFAIDKVELVEKDNLPTEFDDIIRYWDLAGTEDGGDWTVGVLMARKGSYKVYVLDVVREQVSPFKVQDLIARTNRVDELRWGLQVETVAEQEGGSGGKFQAEYTEMRLRGSRVSTETAKENKSKRAEPWAIAMEAAEVSCADAEWTHDYLAEHVLFPKGKHDDQVDASSGAYRRLLKSDEVHVNAVDLAGCATLKGPCDDNKGGSYTTAVGALVFDQMQTYCSFVIFGVNVQARRVACLHHKKWERSEDHGYRIQVPDVVKHVSEESKRLQVAGIAFDPGQCERTAQILSNTVAMFPYPLDKGNRKSIATELLDATSNRTLDLYDDKELFAEIIRLPIKKSVDGFWIEASSDASGPLDLGLAFAIANRWAYGTLADYLDE